MAVYRRTNRARTLLVVLVLAAITLVTIDARGNGSGFLSRARSDVHGALAPVQRATHSALQPIGDFLGGATHYGSLQAENARLRQEIAGLQAGGITAAAEQEEAERVMAAAHLPFLGGIPNLQARVIDLGASNFENTVTIDKGADDGLVAGQPVVAAGADGSTGGLVGSVGLVAAHSATVDLLTDPSFVVGVSLPGGNVGTADGVGAGSALQVKVISTGQVPPQVAKGQVLTTSGLALEQFPPGIPVGKVAAIDMPAGSREPDITLTPLVDLGGLDVVTVELWSPQTAP